MATTHDITSPLSTNIESYQIQSLSRPSCKTAAIAIGIFLIIVSVIAASSFRHIWGSPAYGFLAAIPVGLAIIYCAYRIKASETPKSDTVVESPAERVVDTIVNFVTGKSIKKGNILVQINAADGHRQQHYFKKNYPFDVSSFGDKDSIDTTMIADLSAAMNLKNHILCIAIITSEGQLYSGYHCKKMLPINNDTPQYTLIPGPLYDQTPDKLLLNANLEQLNKALFNLGIEQTNNELYTLLTS